MAWTTDDLLASVKRRLLLPDANGQLSDTDLLALGTESLLEDATPLLTQPRSEYYVQQSDTSIVGDQQAYRLPARAVAAKLREIWYVEGTEERRLHEVPVSRAVEYAGATGSPELYYFEGERVRLLPTPAGSTGSLRMRFYLRRPELVASSATRTITAITVATKTVTLSSAVPAGWDTSDRFDLIRNAGYCDHLGFDLVATTVSGTTIIFSAALPGDLAVGDHVTLAGEASLVCVPEEVYPYVVAATCVRVLQALRDPALAAEHQLAQTRRAEVLALTTPRNDGDLPPVVRYQGAMRQARRYWGAR